MKTIHKFPLEVTGEQTIEAAVISWLDVQVQRTGYGIGNQGVGTICLWAMVDTDAPKTARHIRIFGTGQPVDLAPNEALRYIGTVQYREFVWHVFEKIFHEIE